jgi:hypothetical protein
MKRHLLGVIVAVLWVNGMATGVALAQSTEAPEKVASYRFLPRFSVLNETGGFYPRDIDYRVRGTFDLVTDYNPATDVWGQQAKFANVDAWASHPILAFVLDLDDVLNLSGLEGRQLPVASIFDVFQFTGKTPDGSAVKLFAAQIGPWLRLRGETTPPVGSADMLTYRLSAIAHRTPFADLNEDGVVDAADLAAWTSAPAPNGADLLAWQRQLGEVAPSVKSLDASLDAALASLGGAAGAVPEPCSAMLALAAAAWLLAARRRIP